MTEKMINARVMLKHDTEENWRKATGFIPKLSEPIVYDEDAQHPYKRFKIGDGETNVNALPFSIMNKPFGEETRFTPLEWAGDTNNRDYFSISSSNICLYKVSNIYLEKDQVIGANIEKTYTDNSKILETVSEAYCQSAASRGFTNEKTWMVAVGANMPQMLFVYAPENGCSAGTYMLKYVNNLYVSKLYDNPVITTIEDKYISDNIQRTADAVTSWNQLEDKPFGEEDLHIFIDDATAATIPATTVTGSRNQFYRIYDEFLTPEQAIAAGIISENSVVKTVDGGWSVSNQFFSIYNTTVTLAFSTGATTFDSIGMYKFGSAKCDYTLPNYAFKTLDEKYIPESIARVADIEEALIEVQTDISNKTANVLAEAQVDASNKAAVVLAEAQADASNKAVIVLSEAQADASNKAAVVLAEAQRYTDNAIANIDLPESDSAAIIDVVELPTTDINEKVLYRVLKPVFVQNQWEVANWQCKVVANRNEVTNPIYVQPTEGIVVAYYDLSDGESYGWVGEWIALGLIATQFGLTYKDTITDMAQNPIDDSYNLLLEYKLYWSKDGRWYTDNNIGMKGTGDSAEVFNSITNIATGITAHAEGYKTKASGNFAHAQGYSTEATGRAAHAEGTDTIAQGKNAHAEGFETQALEDESHAEGYQTIAKNKYTHAEGYKSFAGYDNTYTYEDGDTIRGDYAHAEGEGTKAINYSAHAEGQFTLAAGTASHAGGKNSKATGRYSFAHGDQSIASGEAATAFGVGGQILTERNQWISDGSWSVPNSTYFHAEAPEEGGYWYTTGSTLTLVTSSGSYTATIHSITGEGAGQGVFLSIPYTPDMGNEATIYLNESVTASGKASFAGGTSSLASGTNSFAFGNHTEAFAANQFVIGNYNANNSKAKFIIGNGTSSAKKNIFEVIDDNGTAAIKVGNTVITETQLAALLSLNTVYIGNSTPTSETGDNGDIYIVRS